MRIRAYFHALSMLALQFPFAVMATKVAIHVPGDLLGRDERRCRKVQNDYSYGSIN